MAHAPDYQLTYIEGTIQSLATKGLHITPADILTGLWELDAAGIKDGDGETALYSFLQRLTPHHRRTQLENIIFPGWPTVARGIDGDNMGALSQWGADAVRVAIVMRNKYRERASL